MTQTSHEDLSKTDKLLEVRYEFTPALSEILGHLKASLMVTTYQAGKLLVLGVHDGQLKITLSSYDQPMGLALDGDRLAIGSRKQINFLAGNRDVAPTVAPPGTWDVCYVPRTSTWTGSIHGHDLAWGAEGLWVVNTLFSCLCTLHEDFSFVPRWKPRFISQIIDQDRCHLNGLAVDQGRPRFVTAMSETDSAASWRSTKATSGVVIDVESGDTVARGFAMPHSPRWYDGKLWVLDSGRGALCTIDPVTGRISTVETFPGYTRGLSFLGQFAFVGLSRIRETSVFGGVPIADRRSELKCGVGVVDLITGQTVAVFQFLSGITEIFAVEVAANARCPYVAGASSDGQEHDVWIVPQPGNVPSVTARTAWFDSSRLSRSSAEYSEIPAMPLPPQNYPQAAHPMGLEDWLKENPGDASGWIALGNLRQDQNRQAEAVVCYERAVKAAPGMSAARQNLGYLLFNQGHPERAREVFRELLVMDPTPLNRLLAASVLPVVYRSAADLLQWRNEQESGLAALVRDGAAVDASAQLVPTAFFWAYQGLNDCCVMTLRGQLIRGSSDVQNPAGRIRHRADSRLRVGFLSAYFRNHTIGRLNIGRIEKLNRSDFHVTVCSAGSSVDEFSERFRTAADRFIEVPRRVSEAIEVLRGLELDVLIFADVGMDALCSTLAFSRMAPVQCVTWGHPETTGSHCMDYFLSSILLDDESSRSHFTEELILMPLTGTYYERPCLPSSAANIRAKLGLPADRHLYASPQSLFKFHPDDDNVIRRILEADPLGLLIVIEGRVAEWTARLKSRWQTTLGILADRIVFLPAMPHQDYLQLLKACDVILDPLHFGGGNSSYEALAMGTPIVTMPSSFLRGRITAGLYRKMQMTDCIADSVEEYIDLAVKLTTNQEFHQEISRKISESVSVLFEDIHEVHSLEVALMECAGRRR